MEGLRSGCLEADALCWAGARTKSGIMPVELSYCITVPLSYCPTVLLSLLSFLLHYIINIAYIIRHHYMGLLHMLLGSKWCHNICICHVNALMIQRNLDSEVQLHIGDFLKCSCIGIVLKWHRRHCKQSWRRSTLSCLLLYLNSRGWEATSKVASIQDWVSQP